MKKLYYIITLMFITLLASCSQEEMVDKEKEDNRVNISAEFPTDIAATRAPITVPATHQLRCIIEVWTQNANPVLEYRQETIVENGVVPAFDFALLPGDYDCLMWADFVKKDAAVTDVTTGSDVAYKHFEDFCYDTSDLHDVSIKDEQGTTLFDTGLCEGFFASLDLKKSLQPVSRVVKLARPFSQLVLKEKDSDMFATLKSLRVSYEMPKGFNVATGEPTSDMMAAVYSKNFQPGDNSQTLFAGYLFTPSAGFTLGATTLTLTATGKTTNEIPSGTINLVRNQRMTASGNLVTGGGVDPDPEPEPDRDPLVGDYFFKNGTWGSELTDENKDDCVGIVYATGTLSGDDISLYGKNVQGKSIKGYVIALKNTDIFKADFPTENKQYMLSNSRPYFYKQNADMTGKDEDVKVLTKAASDPDWTTYNGYVATKNMLADKSVTGSNDPLNYPVLYIFKKWKEMTAQPANASEWYIPSSGQLLEAAGVCYGFVPNTYYPNNAAQTISQNTAFNNAFNKAIEIGIGGYFSSKSEKGYHVYTSTLNKDAMPMVIQIGTSRVAPHAKPNYKTMGLIRPVLTIIK